METKNTNRTKIESLGFRETLHMTTAECTHIKHSMCSLFRLVRIYVVCVKECDKYHVRESLVELTYTFKQTISSIKFKFGEAKSKNCITGLHVYRTVIIICGQLELSGQSYYVQADLLFFFFFFFFLQRSLSALQNQRTR